MQLLQSCGGTPGPTWVGQQSRPQSRSTQSRTQRRTPSSTSHLYHRPSARRTPSSTQSSRRQFANYASFNPSRNEFVLPPRPITPENMVAPASRRLMSSEKRRKTPLDVLIETWKSNDITPVSESNAMYASRDVKGGINRRISKGTMYGSVPLHGR